MAKLRAEAARRGVTVSELVEAALRRLQDESLVSPSRLPSHDGTAAGCWSTWPIATRCIARWGSCEAWSSARTFWSTQPMTPRSSRSVVGNSWSAAEPTASAVPHLGVVYEFLRVVTHPRVLRKPRSVNEAWGFLTSLLTSPTCTVLVATPRHGDVAIAEQVEVMASFGFDRFAVVGCWSSRWTPTAPHWCPGCPVRSSARRCRATGGRRAGKSRCSAATAGGPGGWAGPPPRRGRARRRSSAEPAHRARTASDPARGRA